MKFILRLLIVVFMLESSWAVAAQYCRHELGLVNQHIGHHINDYQDTNYLDVTQVVLKADPQTEQNIDKDCAYCHLGGMKSMLPVSVIVPLSADPPFSMDVLHSYPRVTPRQPDRPNWRPAA